MLNRMSFSNDDYLHESKDPVEGVEQSRDVQRNAKNYMQRNGSHFTPSHLRSTPAEAKWMIESSVDTHYKARDEYPRGGRGRGEFAPTPLDCFLPTLTYSQGWSVAAANHPTLAAVRRYNEASASERPARCVERVPVGYRPAPHYGGGVAQQPVGLRIRIGGGGRCPRDPLLVGASTGATRKVNGIAPRRFTSAGTTHRRQVKEENLSFQTRSYDGDLVCSTPDSLISSDSQIRFSAAQRLLLSPLLQEVDLQLQRRGVGALSDIWAASPAAMDEVLAQGGFPTTQRETILWEMQRMILASS